MIQELYLRLSLSSRVAAGSAVAMVSFATAGSAYAAPWADPGDPWLRSDIQLLADAGVIRRPVSAWPLSLPDIAQDVAGVDIAVTLDTAEQVALVRLRRLLRAEMRIGERRQSVRLGLAAAPERIREFADTPRGELEGAVAGEYTGERFAVRTQVQLVKRDGADDRRLRPDGTVAGMVAGNWIATAGWQARHWGPGWGGSLVLGSASRPIPGVAVQRLQSQPFELPVLEWVGPWSLTALAGRTEDLSGPARTSDTLLAVRASARPLQLIELGVSGTRLGTDGSNRLAAVDVRWQPRLPGFNLAVYGQVAREQDARDVPDANIALIGVEHWGRSEWLKGNWRAFIEHTDATNRDAPVYRHRGLPIAHGADADGRLTTVAVQLRRDVADDFQVRARFGRLDQGYLDAAGAENMLNVGTDGRARYADIEVRVRRDAQVGTLELGAGYQRLSMDNGRSLNDLRAFAGFAVHF